jgi:hexosaminidase
LYFLLLIFFLLGFSSGHLLAQEKNSLALMPVPAHMVQGAGEFVVDVSFGIELEGYKEPAGMGTAEVPGNAFARNRDSAVA